jgi:hypothetical protein
VLDLNRTRTQETPAWTSTDRTAGGYIYWNGNEPTLGNRGRLFSWRLTTAQLDEEAIGTTANGADMVCDYEGSTHTLGGIVGLFNEGFVEFQPAAGAFTVEAYVDGSGKGSYSIDIGSTLSSYGTGVYGTATYGSSARLMEPWPLPLEAEGRSFATRARYTGQSRFRWYGYAIDFVPEGAMSGV